MRLFFSSKSHLLSTRNGKFWCDTSKTLSKCCHRSVESTISTKQEKSHMFKYLHSKMKACGPITVAEYMKEALTHPTEGYYMKRDVFGSQGDFITSPEISQLFGEMIGVWVLSEWRKFSNDPLQLVELGPGRGTLSKDILKVFKQFAVGNKISIHLVEVSPALSAIQATNLCVSSKEIEMNGCLKHYREGTTQEGNRVFWYNSVHDVPRKFSVFIAHEFFDALPIHKFHNSGYWSEIFIDIDPTGQKFRYVTSKSPTLASKLLIDELETRSHVEISPQTLSIIDYLATFLQECGGFSLIADYGHSGEKTDTFRAFKDHKQQDPLDNPGNADLTADVDFSSIRKIATRDNRTIIFGPVEQREFLMQLGIDVRLNMLLQKCPKEHRQELEAGYHMIIDEDKMGTCFKMLAMFPAVLKEHLTKYPVTGFFEKIVLPTSQVT
ncbi:NADH dehydrogenase [ubiquinone] complex I, assembly factor 7 homolog isoform X2 [Fopius arisanus]|uniref:Protein arginine methyltransferase NDUFAF7 n=1 Tax=Fopius arisanus TaxID=64838 RepID=A0A9R1SWH9_9HYME|nr:PREDICTED: NADH dehydrogenase [ubiquinone] complex I, assembly factor 7 homolog isoform X2 [Fopius arisanus]